MLTKASIQAAIGKTWFTFEEEDEGHFTLSTREHGSVGYETPGRADILEGQRLAGILRAKFADCRVTTYDVDEWVSVEINE